VFLAFLGHKIIELLSILTCCDVDVDWCEVSLRLLHELELVLICLPFVELATTPPTPLPTPTADPFKVEGVTVVTVPLLPSGWGELFFLWKFSIREEAGLKTPLGELSEKSVICWVNKKMDEL